MLEAQRQQGISHHPSMPNQPPGHMQMYRQQAAQKQQQQQMSLQRQRQLSAGHQIQGNGSDGPPNGRPGTPGAVGYQMQMAQQHLLHQQQQQQHMYALHQQQQQQAQQQHLQQQHMQSQQLVQTPQPQHQAIFRQPSGLQQPRTYSSPSLNENHLLSSFGQATNGGAGPDEGSSPAAPHQQHPSGVSAASPHPSQDGTSTPYLREIQDAISRHPSYANIRGHQQQQQANGDFMPPPRRPGMPANLPPQQQQPARAATPASPNAVAAVSQNGLHQASPDASYSQPATPQTPRTPNGQLPPAAPGSGGAGANAAKGRKRTATEPVAGPKETKKVGGFA